MTSPASVTTLPPLNADELAHSQRVVDHIRRFMQQHGGRLLRYAEIQPGMVDLSGGALHDTRM